MARTGLIITSVMEPSDVGLTYSPTRTTYTPRERFAHTIFTLVNASHVVKPHNGDIILADASRTGKYIEDIKKLNIAPNIHYMYMSELSNIVPYHPHKSVGEALILKMLYRYNKRFLEQYDFIIKLSGRYQIGNQLNLDTFIPERDKLYFKDAFYFEGKWGTKLPKFCIIKINDKEIVPMYGSVIYGFHSSRLNWMTDTMGKVIEYLSKPENIGGDMETMLYFLTRPIKNDILSVDWKIWGLAGVKDSYKSGLVGY